MTSLRTSRASTPPPLPPRTPGPTHPTEPVIFVDRSRGSSSHTNLQPLSVADPRTSSTQSLVPSIFPSQKSGSLEDGPSSPSPKRTLLVIYVHGFYGNDQSFRSFPAHVHGFLKIALAETHVIHTKIYPRYKTYHSIKVARDNFSAWLRPHEKETTDVVLVGHSMGGVLIAEVVLMDNTNPYSRYPYQHRILGTVSLDSPFLGLHPGIIGAGLGSLFRPSPAPAPAKTSPETTSTQQGQHADSTELPTQAPASPLTQPQDPPRDGVDSEGPGHMDPADPHFNPRWFNDSPLRERPFLKRLMHFTRKHREEGFFNAATNHFLSHLEYGGCLTDFPGLRARYKRIRGLEDDAVDGLLGSGELYTRTRFVNYYTTCHGVPKRPKTSKAKSTTEFATGGEGLGKNATGDETGEDGQERRGNVGEQEKGEEQDKGETGKSAGADPELSQQPMAAVRHSSDTLRHSHDLDGNDSAPGGPEDEVTVSNEYSTPASTASKSTGGTATFPASPASYATTDATSTATMLDNMSSLELSKNTSSSSPVPDSPSDSALADELTDGLTDTPDKKPKKVKKPKDRKFCMLPGSPDTTWIPVFITDADEVMAHCGLFEALAPHYDGIVGDVAQKMVDWVHEDLSRRMALAFEGR